MIHHSYIDEAERSSAFASHGCAAGCSSCMRADADAGPGPDEYPDFQSGPDLETDSGSASESASDTVSEVTQGTSGGKEAGQDEDETGRNKVYLVKNLHSSESSLCTFSEPISQKTYVVAPSRYGMDMGLVLGALQIEADQAAGGELYTIDRIASDEDMERWRENAEKEKEAYEICRNKIRKHGLDMKLVSAHYLLEEPKVLFFFTAESRVDFRELVKDLVSVFRMRIELRQIGVRDESRVVGGVAVCGRQYCCHSITDKLSPVSIKMAKEQNLSLNSMKISGPCGRLLCCLSYEFDYYHEEKRKWPAEGSRLKIGEELCRIHEVNIISRKIYVYAGDGRMFSVPFSFLQQDADSGRWHVHEQFLEESEQL